MNQVFFKPRWIAAAAVPVGLMTLLWAPDYVRTRPAGNYDTNPKNATVTQKQFQLDGTASTSADGKPLTYQWTVPAGSPVAAILNANTATPTVQFEHGQGTYVFLLTATDSSGKTATDTATIAYVGQ